MPNFVWKGRTRTGKIEEGVLVADTKDAAAAILRRQQIQVTTLRPKEARIPLLPKLGGRVNSQKLSIFTRQFSVMLDAGLPLVQCLEILGNQEDHKIFKAIIEAVTPAVLAKGEDWRDKGVVGREWVEQHGGQVVLVPLVAGRSTTNLVEKIRATRS